MLNQHSLEEIADIHNLLGNIKKEYESSFNIPQKGKLVDKKSDEQLCFDFVDTNLLALIKKQENIKVSTINCRIFKITYDKKVYIGYTEKNGVDKDIYIETHNTTKLKGVDFDKVAFEILKKVPLHKK